MGNYVILPMLMLAVALQASIVPQIRLLGGGPDLVYLLVLAWAIHARLEESVAWAFAGGIMQDLLSSAPTGASSLVLIMLVFVIAALNQQMYRIGWVLLVGLVLVGTFAQQVIGMVVFSLGGVHVDWLSNLGYVVIPTMFYNLLFIWPIYWLVRRIQRRVESDYHRFS